MPTFAIKIPDWSEGCPLHIDNIEAASEQEARQKVIDWVNRLAGYPYCTELPPGTTCREQRSAPCK